MLHEFLKSNRMELIERCRRKVSARRVPSAASAATDHGVPLFLDQLTEMLAHANRDPIRSQPAVGIPATPAEASIDAGATIHGQELLLHNFTIDQVVHD